MPGFCKCGVNKYAVDENADGSGSYEYHNTDYCPMGAFKKNITLTIKGELNATAHGSLMENAALFNHTLPLKPNYVFHVERDAAGSLQRAYTYACLGKLPLHSKESFAFYLLERAGAARAATSEAINARIAGADKSTGGLLDFAGVRVDNATTFAGCGMLTE